MPTLDLELECNYVIRGLIIEFWVLKIVVECGASPTKL